MLPAAERCAFSKRKVASAADAIPVSYDAVLATSSTYIDDVTEFAILCS
jgi:hypothetical protein